MEAIGSIAAPSSSLTGRWFSFTGKSSLSVSRTHVLALGCDRGQESFRKLWHHLPSPAGSHSLDELQTLSTSDPSRRKGGRSHTTSSSSLSGRADGLAAPVLSEKFDGPAGYVGVQHLTDHNSPEKGPGSEHGRTAHSEAAQKPLDDACVTTDSSLIFSEETGAGNGSSFIESNSIYGGADASSADAVAWGVQADKSLDHDGAKERSSSGSIEAQASPGEAGSSFLSSNDGEETTSCDDGVGLESTKQRDRTAGNAPGTSGRKPPRKQYVWPELRNNGTGEPDYEFLTVDPSDIPERQRTSTQASSSGRANKYMAPTPQSVPQRKAPSVKRDPSVAAQRCLTLLREYKDPAKLPYEEFKETLRTWVAENAPCRSDGMDVLRKLLDFRETNVFVRVNEHFLREPWFKAQLRDINKLLDVLVTNRMFLKAESRFGKMLRKGIAPDCTTYNLMIHHYGLWKRPDKAEEMFLDMRTQGIRPNEDTYVALMGALTRAGRLVEAERLLRTMRKSRCPRGPAAYVTLMEAYGHEEEPEEAERVFLMIQADGIPLGLPAFLGLMHVYAELRKPHQVERVFREMLSQRILPDETAYLVLIDSYRKAGLGKNCERLVEEMQLLGLSPYKAAALIMEAYGAEQLFSEAERILIDLEAKTGMKPGVMHYNALLASYGRHGLHKDAMKVFDWMTEAGVALNERSHVIILDLFDRTGRKANMRKAFRIMQADGFGLEYEAAVEAVLDYRATLNEYEPELEEVREERLKKRAERAARFMQKWDTWSRELDELDREIAEVEIAAEKKLDKWESRTRV